MQTQNQLPPHFSRASSDSGCNRANEKEGGRNDVDLMGKYFSALLIRPPISSRTADGCTNGRVWLWPDKPPGAIYCTLGLPRASLVGLPRLALGKYNRWRQEACLARAIQESGFAHWFCFKVIWRPFQGNCFQTFAYKERHLAERLAT